MNLPYLLPGIKNNVSLKNYTTFKTGGKAKYFFVARNKENIISAIATARKFKLPFFIIGKGSNLLASDRGFKGIVIKIQNTKYKILNTKIVAEAGILLSQLVSETIKKNLTGLEWAVGIPGTLGGAIYGNAGAFKKSIGDNTKEVEVYDLKSRKLRILKNKDCKFKYRESVFKENKNLVILSAELQLKKGDERKIEDGVKEYLNYRKNTQPLNFPSIGSIFKNTPLHSAGELIEKCGLKGKRIGHVQISEKHANFIVNLGKGKAKDVVTLIKLIQKKVKNRFNIGLKEEVQYLPSSRESHYWA